MCRLPLGKFSPELTVKLFNSIVLPIIEYTYVSIEYDQLE